MEGFAASHPFGVMEEEVYEKVQRMLQVMPPPHVKQGDEGRQRGIKRQSQISSLIDKSNVFGRGSDKEELIKLMLVSNESASSSSKDICVIPIVGIGGLGKTTLSQLIYNDKRVEDHFQVRGWVCVSEDFDICRITKAIFESMTKKRCCLNEIDPLQVSLKEVLSCKRFLLVLDDVWNDCEWQRLQAPFSFGAKGSRITTTNLGFAYRL
ncbi:disease resistance protein RGA2-like [Tasmannia lanceolata]|uniref:disease resistance protein RGA2-like n=1 Tax=Tasmannia lanceolata TaxID=3420 RepID=UPI004062F9C6